MTEQKKVEDEATEDETARGDVGDVEMAGETTAAIAIGGGDAHNKPVGADTLVPVAGTDKTKTEGDDS